MTSATPVQNPAQHKIVWKEPRFGRFGSVGRNSEGGRDTKCFPAREAAKIAGVMRRRERKTEMRAPVMSGVGRGLPTIEESWGVKRRKFRRILA